MTEFFSSSRVLTLMTNKQHDDVLSLRLFLPMARKCAKNRKHAKHFNFAALVKTIEAEQVAEALCDDDDVPRSTELGRLLTEALAQILRDVGDCAHVPEQDREPTCYSCQTMFLCDRIWSALRFSDDDDEEAVCA